MTAKEFIRRIDKNVTRSGAIPVHLPKEEYERIIEEAREYFFERDTDSTSEFIGILPNALFQTDHFKQNRWIEFDECIYSVYEFIENRRNQNMAWSQMRQFSKQKVLNSVYYDRTSDIVTYVAYQGYDSVLQNLSDKYIAFDWNFNENRLHVLGHDPRGDVSIRGFRKITDEKLYNSRAFRDYVTGHALIAMSEILTAFNYKLPSGGTSSDLDFSQFKERGENLIEKVETDFDEETNVNWFMEF